MNDNTALQLDYGEEFVPVVKSENQKNVVLHEITKKREHAKEKGNILFKVGVLAILGLVVALRFASITEINYKNQSLQAQYDELVSKEQEIRVSMETEMSVTEISRIAQTELGMQKPQTYQIVYVDAGLEDRTETVNVEYTQDSVKLPWYRQLVTDIKEFFGFI